MGKRFLVCSAVATLLLPATGSPAERDVRAIHLPNDARQVIETRCLGCHGQQRIDHALSEKRDMDSVMTRMEKKGAALTDADRQVMRIYWQQQLFREKNPQGQPR